MEKFSIEYQIGPSHLDVTGALSIRSMIDLLQDCSIFQLDSEPLLADFFKKTNSGMFLSQRQIELHRMPRHGEKVKVVSWVYRCNPSFGYRNTNIYAEDGSLCVCTSAVGAFVDYHSGQMIRIPQEIMNSVPLYEPYDMVYLPRKIKIGSEKNFRTEQPVFVWHYLLDANKHVNNARYVSVAQEYVSCDFHFDRIRVEYLKPAQYGQSMLPKIAETEDACFVLLDDEYGSHYAVVEFSRREKH